MKKVLYPALGEVLLLLCWTCAAVAFLYLAYRSAWVLSYSGESVATGTIVRRFAPDAFSFGLLLLGLLILAIAWELLGRSVTIGAEGLRSRSPIGLYRQSVRKAEIADFRVTSIRGWGRIVEFKVGGRWIVFLANSRFADRTGFYLQAARDSERNSRGT